MLADGLDDLLEMRRIRPLLGTFVEVGVRLGAQATAGAPAAVDAAFHAVAQAQSLWSFQSPDSELSQLNRYPGERLPLHRQTLHLLRLAKGLMLRSGAAFDCTVGGALVQGGALPDHGGPQPLPHGCADDIEIGSGWARLRRPVRLTLDGIAKGYAVDLALAALRRPGVVAGWINAGGDLRVFGDLLLPVQRREADGRFTALGGLRNAALATSWARHGDSGRSGQIDRAGRIDGSDGIGGGSGSSGIGGNDCNGGSGGSSGSGGSRRSMPDQRFAARIVASAGHRPSPGVWTVLARSAWRADALTKVAANTPADRRAGLIAQLGGCLVSPGALPQAKAGAIPATQPETQPAAPPAALFAAPPPALSASARWQRGHCTVKAR